jgi:hypothetical protein
MAAALRFELAKLDIPMVVHTCEMGEHPWQAKRHAMRSACERYGGSVFWLDADCVVRDLQAVRGLLHDLPEAICAIGWCRPYDGGRVVRRVQAQVRGALRIAPGEVPAPCDWFWGLGLSRHDAAKFFGAWDVVVSTLRNNHINSGDAISNGLAAAVSRVPVLRFAEESVFKREFEHKRLGPLDADFRFHLPKG